MAAPKEIDNSGSITHYEVAHPLEIEQGNAAILLDIGEWKGGESGQAGLKLTKDGHV